MSFLIDITSKSKIPLGLNATATQMFIDERNRLQDNQDFLENWVLLNEKLPFNIGDKIVLGVTAIVMAIIMMISNKKNMKIIKNAILFEPNVKKMLFSVLNFADRDNNYFTVGCSLTATFMSALTMIGRPTAIYRGQGK